MHYLFLTIFITMFSFQGKEPDKKDLVLSSYTIDLGTLNLKQKKDTIIYYENNSAKPVVITKVETACGCTKIKFSKKPVPVDGRDSLIVTFDAKDLGAFYKKVYIYNTSANDKVILNIRGVVK